MKRRGDDRNETWDYLRRMADYDYKPMLNLDKVGFHWPKSYIFRTAWWLSEFGILESDLRRQDRRWVEDIETYFEAKNIARMDVDLEKDEIRKLRGG